MRELSREESAANEAKAAALEGVPEALLSYFEPLLSSGIDAVVAFAEALLPAASYVKPNDDGSVYVDLRSSVKVGRESQDRIKLRAIRGIDYVNGLTADLVHNIDYAPTVRFASALCETKGAVEALSDTRDVDAVFLGVMAIRGKWSRPTK